MEEVKVTQETTFEEHDETAERVEYIMMKLQRQLDSLQDMGYNIAGIFLRGSQNYNVDIQTASYSSDVDSVAIVIPTLDNLVTKAKMISKEVVMPDDSHVIVKDVRLLSNLFYQANSTFLEILCTPYKIIQDDLLNRLWDMSDEITQMNREKLLNSIKWTIHGKHENMHKHRSGRREVFDKYGYDPKELHHMMRLYFLMRDLFVYKLPFEMAMTPDEIDVKYLIDLKTEPLELDKANNLAEIIARNTYSMYYAICNKETFEVNEDTNKKMQEVIAGIVKDKIKSEIQEHE